MSNVGRRARSAAVLIVAAAFAVGATTASSPPVAAQTAPPSTVTIAGSLQSDLGCPGDWQPECPATGLTAGTDGVWRAQFTLPGGSYEYKAALNGTWDENYGAGAVFNGPNIAVTVPPAGGAVRFYYSHATHWVTDSVNDRIVTAAGDFQSELGCAGDWDPACLRTWLQDADGDGVYELETTDLPAGGYEWKAALDEAWTESYGEGGGSANAVFTVAAGDRVTLRWDSATNIPTAEVEGTSGLEAGDADLVTEPVRTSTTDEVVYFVMTDRFADGQPDNNRAGSASDDRLVHGYDPAGKGWYHGGDLAGLLGQLDYVEDLGVTALWITPPFTNRWVQGDLTPGGTSAGYHGYWQVDYTEIDPHLGTNEEMQALVDEAHERGMKVYFDIVLNHTGDVITYAEGVFTYRNKTVAPYRDALGEPFDDRDYAGTETFPELDVEESFPYTPTFLTPADASIKQPAWLNDPTLYHNRGNSTFVGENSLYGDFFGLDDLFTEHPDVVDGMIDIHTAMIEDFDIDGFRVDTVKHVNDELWEEFVPAVREAGGPDFALFGEVFDGDPAYLSRFSTELPFPSTLDFRFSGTVNGIVASSAATSGLQTVFADDDWFTDADSNALGLTKFVGNHDIGRVGAAIQSAGTPAEQWLPRARLAQVLNFTTRGAPVVYYGDEQGFTGGDNTAEGPGDQNARQDVFPSQVASYNDDDLIGTDATTAVDNHDPTHPLYVTIAELAALRRDHLALRQGAQLHRFSEGTAGIYAFSRIERAEQVEYVVAINNSPADDTATFTTDSPATEFAPLYGATAPVTTTAAGAISLTVPALSAVVYRAAQGVPGDEAFEAISITTPTDGAEVTGRVPVRAQVSGGRWAEVTFAASLDGGETFEVIGVDDNAPYAVYHDVAGLAGGAPVEYRAIVTDVAGNLNADGVTVTVAETEEPPPPGTPTDATYAVVHYQRADGVYDGWTLEATGDLAGDTAAAPFVGEDDYGRFAWVELDPGADEVSFEIRNGATVDGAGTFDPSQTPEIWLRAGEATIHESQASADGFVTVHYQRADGAYDGWGLHLWGDGIAPGTGTGWTTPRPFDGIDDFGAYWRVPLDPTRIEAGAPVNFIIHQGDEKDPDPDQSLVPTDQPSAWHVSGDTAVHPTRSAALGLATIHYHRPAGDYGDQTSTDFNQFWGLHVWAGALTPNPAWQDPVRAVRQDPFGLVFEVRLQPDATSLSHIIHRGDAKDPGPDMSLDLVTYGNEVWIESGADPERPWILPIVGGGGPAGDLATPRAYWVSADTIIWPTDAADSYRLHHDPDGGLAIGPSGVGGQSIRLTPTTADPAILAKFPHLTGLPALRIPADQVARATGWLRGQVAVSATDTDLGLVDATGLQVPGVLDDVYANDEALGVTWDGDVPTVRLWAPTAKSVALQLFPDGAPISTPTTLAMTRDDESGVWSVTGDASWRGRYYLYDVEVYVAAEDEVVHNVVTDPYSLSLSTNSQRSQFVDLNDPALAPDGWADVEKPPLEAPEDLSIYELHVRDFSASDPAVAPELQGTFEAFTLEDSAGMQHLASLADAGLGAVHLLPAFDFATVNEDRSTWQQPDPALLETYEPDSERQQEAVEATRTVDGFNWGYDPWHYTTPEGSYATDPEGPARIVEFRDMVAALNETGLRVIMDVVYNHTTEGGQGPKSVLDRIVPGYYHRLLEDGTIATSTCCANTASEHAMMEKLLIDSVVTWARDYKVDGFRFDLMGHHSKATMLKLRAALDALTVDADGVDGVAIYLYGEGWNFGEVADNARFVQATQINMAGTGIGTFNDRLRDAVRGGGPFDGGDDLVRNQGIINGVWYDPNEFVQSLGAAELERQRAELLLSADQLRVGLAGNLAAYTFVDRTGATVTGAQVPYNGAPPVGYNADPQEHIVYVAAHDNQTLFDMGQYHHPLDTTMADRVRAQNLGLDMTVFAQGVPFIHAGEELLRSKSMDRNSYDSGDWFNRLDLSGETSNWGSGLPPRPDNEANWPLIQPRLRDLPAPGAADIEATADHVREVLAIREQSPLFRLETAPEVQERLAFANTGPAQIPGLIVMTLDDPGRTPRATGDLDPATDRLAVLFNATDEEVTYAVGSWAGEDGVALHPVQAASADDVVRGASFDDATGTFTIPARTTAVFVDAADDVTAPTVTAELAPLLVGRQTGLFQVRTSCADDVSTGDELELVADVNGAPVDDGDVVLLIVDPRRSGWYRLGSLTIIWGPSFTLTATCTDAAGNAATATDVAVFRRR